MAESVFQPDAKLKPGEVHDRAGAARRRLRGAMQPNQGGEDARPVVAATAIAILDEKWVVREALGRS